MLTREDLQLIREVIKEEIHKVDIKVDRLEQRFGKLEQKVNKFEEKIDEFEQKFDYLDQQIDRVYDAALDGFERVLDTIDELDKNYGQRIVSLEKHAGFSI